MSREKREVEIKVAPEWINDLDYIRAAVARKLRRPQEKVGDFQVIKRSIDARKRPVLYLLRISLGPQDPTTFQLPAPLHHTKPSKRVIIVGAGPAGYFAALECIELGLKPIVVDRGKDVRARRRDLREIQQFHRVNPDSNYCFGEGGAGTYSDGKLYTRSVKRGNVRKVLEILVRHGAAPDILVDAHPHIGSNKLPKIVAAIRQTIEDLGGEVHFNQRVVGFAFKGRTMLGVETQTSSFMGDAVVLATGHSARDIYELCAQHDINLSFKPFAIGVRVEHPQALIDTLQYHAPKRHPNLPAASYRLACQVNGKGVFSFCMCPGGLIVPTATAPGELVVNGMSLSKRDSPFANSGMVVSIDQNPVPGDVFGGLHFQQALERRFFEYGSGSQAAPAQRLTDFIEGRVSDDLPDTSYIPGVYAGDFSQLLPPWIYLALQQAVRRFDFKMSGYLTSEAQLVGLESRTSSPVRIERGDVDLMAGGVTGLFPCGEGAGYAGGILSAALDGERVAHAVHVYLSKT